MYTLRTDTDELLYSPGVDELAMLEIKASLELNKTGMLQFQIPPTHPLYEKIVKIQSDIYLYEDETFLWKFRVLNEDVDFINLKTTICEGELSYLLDSVQRPFEFQGKLPDLFKQFIDVHNSQVETRKQFKVGNITVVDTNDYINRSDGHISKTLVALNEKLVKTHGGFIRTRRNGNDVYIDYIDDYQSVNPQEIRFGENLLDITRFIKGEHIRTALIPQGAETDEDGINGVKKRVDITSVNDGKDYIFDQTAVNMFGWIWDTIEMDDVTIPANLKSKSEAYLREQINFQMKLELTAIDLHLLDVNIKGIRIGDWIRVVSEPHGLDKLFLVHKIDLDISNPEQSKIYLGGTITTLTASVTKDKNNISNAVKEVSRSNIQLINEKVDNATDLITGTNGGYMIIRYDTNGKPYEQLFMDHPSVDDAEKVLRINRNGIGFSTTGIDGPYKNAWTIDGNLVADFITGGTMMAERISGGELLLGYTEDKVDGSLVVVDSYGDVVLAANKNGVGIGGDYFSFYSDGREKPLTIGGFAIWEDRDRPGYDGIYYWESNGTRENGIASSGPWVVWGGWDPNSGDAMDPANYTFVAFQDGRVKAMSWITGSRAEDKKNIEKFEKSALDIVDECEVHEYDLKKGGAHRIGFVIGEGYKVADEVLDGDKSGIEMYSALAVAYKAIQELEEEVEELKKKVGAD